MVFQFLSNAARGQKECESLCKHIEASAACTGMMRSSVRSVCLGRRILSTRLHVSLKQVRGVQHSIGSHGCLGGPWLEENQNACLLTVAAIATSYNILPYHCHRLGISDVSSSATRMANIACFTCLRETYSFTLVTSSHAMRAHSQTMERSMLLVLRRCATSTAGSEAYQSGIKL
jgi:hypothetical protein